jgi:hypothetical protein
MHTFLLKCVLPSTGAVVSSDKTEEATRTSSPGKSELADTLEDVPYKVSVLFTLRIQLLTRQCSSTAHRTTQRNECLSANYSRHYMARMQTLEMKRALLHTLPAFSHQGVARRFYFTVRTKH